MGWSTNLAAGFVSLGGATNLTTLWPAHNVWTDTLHGAEVKGFYRIGVRVAE